MAILLILPMAVVGMISYHKTAILEVAMIQKEDMEKVSKKAEAIFKEYENELGKIAELPEIQFDTYDFPNNNGDKIRNLPTVNDPNKEQFYQSFLQTLAKDNDYLLNLYVATESGELYLNNIPDGDLSSFDTTSAEWYTSADNADGKVIWTFPYIDNASGNTTVTLAKNITDNNGETVGVVAMDFNMSKLASLLRSDMLQTTFITALITLIIGIGIVYIFVKRLLKKLAIIRKGLGKVANGDLSGEAIPVTGERELRDMATSVNAMKDNLLDILSGIRNASDSVTAQSEELTQSAKEVKVGSEQIATTMQELASGTENLSTNIGSIAEQMEEFNQMTQQAYANGEDVASSSNNVLEMTRVGSGLMNNSILQMEEISKIVHDSVDKVKELDNQSKEISKLVNVIKDIADQTNLLALNAAIEAARAGEHGRGFAVVADEVRKLAEQVSHSLGDITKIVEKIQLESTNVSNALEQGYVAVNEGSEKIATTGETFEKMNHAVSSMAEKIQHISSNLKNISENSNVVNHSIEEIASISEESAAGVEEVAASSEQSSSSMDTITDSAEQLARLAEQLHEQIRKFTL